MQCIERNMCERGNDMETGYGASAFTAKERVPDGGMEHIKEGALHTLVNALPAYLYSVHYQNGIAVGTIHSHQCHKVTGYSSSEYVRDPDLWLKMVHPQDQDTVREFFNTHSNIPPSNNGGGLHRYEMRGNHPVCACHDEGYMLEHRIIHKEGVVRWIANRCVATHDEKGRLLRVDGLVMDITAQKAAEDDMVARLEKERQRAAEMESLKKRAEDAVAQNNRFMSLIVHDLRSPITSVISFLKLLERQCNEGDFGSVAEVIRRIGGINENLLTLIDDLLSVSRIKNGVIQQRKRFFDALALAQQVLDGFRLQADMKGITLKCEVAPGIRLYADFNLTHEVVGNLVSNAVKFCGKGNTITISARLGPLPTVAVANDGPPISPALLSNLFSFDTVTSTPGSAGERGNGLGLPLSAEIMRLQGGALRAANVIEGGCVFEAVFPAIRPVVLVVDDNEIDRFALRGLLSHLDIELIVANNGKAALKIMESREVHLVIADLIMPEMDGYELLRIIRENTAYGNIQFIALTGFPESEICQRVMGMGADDFIRKPVCQDDLVIRVRRFVA